MNVLIAESGSTKTDWRLIKGKKTLSFQTIGFNPYHIGQDKILEELAASTLKSEVININILYFYGAGCSSIEKKKEIKSALKAFFTNAEIYVEHDLLAAARACCGKEKGMVAILGTGSNSCLFDGENIIQNIPSLGYILGDEGSGAYMGKLLLQMYLYGNLGHDLKKKFETNYEHRLTTILNSVYKEPLPNRFLAQFTHFIKENENHTKMDSLIKKAFSDFFENHITRYKEFNTIPLNLVGSIANIFSNQLKEVAIKYDVQIDKILKNPIEELVSFHTSC